ncbi:MAG: hypothetical protein ACREBF_00100 [Candidatus Micrarchaeales archaeon]
MQRVDNTIAKNYLNKSKYLKLAHWYLLFLKNIYILVRHYNKTSWHTKTLNDEAIEKNYRIFYNTLYRELESKKSGYPNNMFNERALGFLVYYLCKSVSPKNILETGIANGFTSRIIRESLEKGHLYSTEVDKNTGILAIGNFKVKWEKIIGYKYFNLMEALSVMKNIDLFILDSGHSYENKLFELTVVHTKFPGSLVLTGALAMKAIIQHCKTNRLDFLIVPSYPTSFCLIFPHVKRERLLQSLRTRKKY